jgi:hypothetical protein
MRFVRYGSGNRDRLMEMRIPGNPEKGHAYQKIARIMVMIISELGGEIEGA